MALDVLQRFDPMTRTASRFEFEGLMWAVITNDASATPTPDPPQFPLDGEGGVTTDRTLSMFAPTIANNPASAPHSAEPLDGSSFVYTDATKTLTLAGAFRGYTPTRMDIVQITGGTGVTTGYYDVAKKIDEDSIQLKQSIGMDSSDVLLRLFGRDQFVRIFGGTATAPAGLAVLNIQTHANETTGIFFPVAPIATSPAVLPPEAMTPPRGFCFAKVSRRSCQPTPLTLSSTSPPSDGVSPGAMARRGLV